MKRAGCALLALVLLGCSGAPGDFPYDERQDANAAVEHARVAAEQSGRLLLINFGANWCTDCRTLAAAVEDEPLKSSIESRFVTVKVDVGNWDRNQTLVQAYGDPTAEGIPAIVVVEPERGDVLYASRAGELANARNMSRDALAGFLEAVWESSHHTNLLSN